MSDTQQENAEQLLEAFGLFDDWEDRYQYLIDLGRKLPKLDEAEKTEENLIPGCQNRVWLVADVGSREGQEVVEFRADSEGSIAKGLIALLWKVYSGQPAEKILSFDIEGFLNRLGLRQNLVMNRQNGLNNMIQRIRLRAAQLMAEPAAGS